MSSSNDPTDKKEPVPSIPPFPTPLKPSTGELLLLLRKIEKNEREFREFITDSLESHRVVDREQLFILDLQKGMKRGLITTFSDLSDRQLLWARSIQKKVYKT
jgi:hypothetical protein